MAGNESRRMEPASEERHMRRMVFLVVAGLVVLRGVATAQVATDCTTAPDGAPCDDGIFCNGTDQCGTKMINGRPARGCFFHSGDPCIGGPACANDACDEQQDNCYNPAGTPCLTDGNVCTDDACDGAGKCVHLANTTACDDGVFCNGEDTCANASCSVHAGDPCAGGAECADVCNEDANNCFVRAAPPTPCTADENDCTDDVCDGLGTCAHVPNNNPCNDGIFCNGPDTCGDGRCNFHMGDPCAGGCVEICDEAADSCVEPAGTPCEDDDNPCTEDQCSGGGCVHRLIPGCDLCRNDADCEDSNPCTADACGASGCESTTVPGCQTCVADADCDDGDACTLDECDPTGQCVYPQADCFAAVRCTFVPRLGVETCSAEAIPATIVRLVDKAGCKVEQAEARARRGRGRVEKRLQSAERRLLRAAKKVEKARLTTGCASGLATDLADRMGRIALLMDEANGGSQLASCTEALTVPDAAPQQSGPSLCRKR
jgi:hypothetical protein